MAKKILLADDSLTIQKVVELTFSESDYDLVCVSNGQRALEKVDEDRPDLVLADVIMPEKNGYEVCEAIKGNPKTSRIPVVLLSGTFEPFDRERAQRIGCDLIISKPFDSQQLLRQVEELLSRAAATASAAEVVTPKASSGSATEPLVGGFASEEFPAPIRSPADRAAGPDVFEEFYGHGDVVSAIRAFESAYPVSAGEVERTEEEDRSSSREALAQWLQEEPESAEPHSPNPVYSPALGWRPREAEPIQPLDFVVDESGSFRRAEGAPPRAAEGPTIEIPPFQTVRLGGGQSRPFSLAGSEEPGNRSPLPPASAGEVGREGPEEISDYEAKVLFEVSAPAEAPSGASAGTGAPDTPVPPEIEELAQTSTIPELTEMLSSVSKPPGEMTEAELDRLADRVVEKLSERVLREIAWEVIPDMAEIVIKRRIKELEGGIE